MATRPAFTKRGDTEVIWVLNMNLTGSTVKAFVKGTTGDSIQLPATVVNAAKGQVSVTTASLPVDKYKLEIEVTSGSNIATFPDEKYASLVVYEDLG